MKKNNTYIIAPHLMKVDTEVNHDLLNVGIRDNSADLMEEDEGHFFLDKFMQIQSHDVAGHPDFSIRPTDRPIENEIASFCARTHVSLLGGGGFGRYGGAPLLGGKFPTSKTFFDTEGILSRPRLLVEEDEGVVSDFWKRYQKRMEEEKERWMTVMSETYDRREMPYTYGEYAHPADRRRGAVPHATLLGLNTSNLIWGTAPDRAFSATLTILAFKISNDPDILGRYYHKPVTLKMYRLPPPQTPWPTIEGGRISYQVMGGKYDKASVDRYREITYPTATVTFIPRQSGKRSLIQRLHAMGNGTKPGLLLPTDATKDDPKRVNVTSKLLAASINSRKGGPDARFAEEEHHGFSRDFLNAMEHGKAPYALDRILAAELDGNKIRGEYKARIPNPEAADKYVEYNKASVKLEEIIASIKETPNSIK